MKKYSSSCFVDVSPSPSPQAPPHKGDIWSQMMSSAGDSWMGSFQMRGGSKSCKGNQMDWAKRQHTLTELPSYLKNDRVFKTVNQGDPTVKNDNQRNSHYGTPLTITIPNNEMSFGSNVMNSGE